MDSSPLNYRPVTTSPLSSPRQAGREPSTRHDDIAAPVRVAESPSTAAIAFKTPTRSGGTAQFLRKNRSFGPSPNSDKSPLKNGASFAMVNQVMTAGFTVHSKDNYSSFLGGGNFAAHMHMTDPISPNGQQELQTPLDQKYAAALTNFNAKVEKKKRRAIITNGPIASYGEGPMRQMAPTQLMHKVLVEVHPGGRMHANNIPGKGSYFKVERSQQRVAGGVIRTEKRIDHFARHGEFPNDQTFDGQPIKTIRPDPEAFNRSPARIYIPPPGSDQTPIARALLRDPAAFLENLQNTVNAAAADCSSPISSSSIAQKLF